MTRRFLVAMLVVCSQVSFTLHASAQLAGRSLSCDGPFRPNASATSLAEFFGSTNVVSAEIDVGEGFTEPGTVVFADTPADRVEVLWMDKTTERGPLRVTLRAGGASRPASHWRTPGGLTLGIHLRELERLNRRPFRLLGFAWDYEGTVMSWGGGGLDTGQPSGCRIRARLTTGELLNDLQRRGYKQVIGDHEFSSGHPAMQALDPFVHELWLDYERAR